MLLNKIRVSTRLTLSYASLLAIFSLVLWFSVTGLRQAAQSYNASVVQGTQVTLASKWAASTRLNVNRVLAIAHSGKDKEVDAHFSPLIAQTSQEINELQKSLEKTLVSPQDQQEFAAVSAARAQYIAARKSYFDLLEKDGAESSLRALNSTLLPAADKYMSLQSGFLESLERARLNQAQETQADVSRAVFSVVAWSIGSLVLGIVVAWVMVASITTPIGKALAASRRIEQGNLSQDIHIVCKDEFGALLRSMHSMQTSLRTVVQNIHSSSDNLIVSSHEIASASMDLSARTEQAASSLEQTAASVEQLTATVHNSAASSKNASALAENSCEAVHESKKAMDGLGAKMKDIQASGQRIGDIISLVESIAFQTNILALNAAVEAARAGEQGRGFAVVASEVRALAKRSSDAAKEITALISLSAQDVARGNQYVEQTQQTMQTVVERVQAVRDIVSQITLATTEQSIGLSQINEAVAHLDQMTQQNAALVEQTSAAAAHLHEQAGQLGQAVSLFRTNA